MGSSGVRKAKNSMNGALLHFFAGKGGAGKTTLATAYALTLAEQQPKDKVLLACFEPVGSLTDLLKKKVLGKPTKIVPGKGNGGLFAVELDPKAALEAFVQRYQPALAKSVQK